MNFYLMLDIKKRPYAYCVTSKNLNYEQVRMYMSLGDDDFGIFEEYSYNTRVVLTALLKDDFYTDDWSIVYNSHNITLTKKDLKSLKQVNAIEIEDIVVVAVLTEIGTGNYIGCSDDYEKVFKYINILRDKDVYCTITRILCKNRRVGCPCSIIPNMRANKKEGNIDLMMELDDKVISKYLLLN